MGLRERAIEEYEKREADAEVARQEREAGERDLRYLNEAMERAGITALIGPTWKATENPCCLRDFGADTSLTFYYQPRTDRDSGGLFLVAFCPPCGGRIRSYHIVVLADLGRALKGLDDGTMDGWQFHKCPEPERKAEEAPTSELTEYERQEKVRAALLVSIHEILNRDRENSRESGRMLRQGGHLDHAKLVERQIEQADYFEALLVKYL